MKVERYVVGNGVYNIPQDAKILGAEDGAGQVVLGVRTAGASKVQQEFRVVKEGEAFNEGKFELVATTSNYTMVFRRKKLTEAEELSEELKPKLEAVFSRLADLEYTLYGGAPSVFGSQAERDQAVVDYEAKKRRLQWALEDLREGEDKWNHD